MRFIVLGATGATGRQVVQRAAAAGHDIVAYVRNPEAVERREHVSVVGGSIDDVAALTEAVRGAGAVISCLGPPLSPKLLFDVDIIQRGVIAAVAAMREAEVDRFVLMSAFGVGDTGSHASLVAQLVNSTVIRAANADKLHAERILAASPLDWSVVYPVRLTNGPERGSVRVVPVEECGDVPGMPTVSRADVAAVLVDVASQPAGPHRRLFVG